LTYPIWPEAFKNKTFISCFWLFNLVYTLIFIACLQVILSKLGEFQLMIFMLNILILAILTRWQISIIMIFIGVFASMKFFNWYVGEDIPSDLGSLQFKVIYILLLTSSILLAFFKPKQEHLEKTEAKVGNLKTEVIYLDHEVTGLNDQVEVLNKQKTHYSKTISDQEKEIDRLGATAQKILNNVNHELRLPVGNVMNFSEMLHEGLEKHSPEHLRELSDEVYKNSTRLSSMILNMLDLANLDVKRINLEKTLVNLSEIVKDRVKSCRSVYSQDKPVDFKLLIDPEIMISVDPNYLRQTIDNLVINAINFSKKGIIEIKAQNQKHSIIFTITDQGVGIPKNDLVDIFTPFKMGSNNISKAEGRGVGLALCKSVIEAHGGSIAVKSNGKGATFRFVLPK